MKGFSRVYLAALALLVGCGDDGLSPLMFYGGYELTAADEVVPPVLLSFGPSFVLRLRSDTLIITNRERATRIMVVEFEDLQTHQTTTSRNSNEYFWHVSSGHAEFHFDCPTSGFCLANFVPPEIGELTSDGMRITKSSGEPRVRIYRRLR